jgi:hypothetical protein
MQAAPLPDFEKAQARAASWLRAWDRQGLHRTGTAGDLAGAEWHGQEAMALGADVWVEEFALDRVDPVECFVEFGVRQIAAVPVFDAPSTDPATPPEQVRASQSKSGDLISGARGLRRARSTAASSSACAATARTAPSSSCAPASGPG